MQNVSKRPLPAFKVITRVNLATEGAFNRLSAHFTAGAGPQSGKVPSIAKANAHRTFMPGHGNGIRVDLFVGPIHMIENKEGLAVMTSKTANHAGSYEGTDTVDSLESTFTSALGGMSSSIKVYTADVRDVDSRKYTIDRGFEDGKRVWVIINRETGKPAYYVPPKSSEQNVEDPYREAIFTSSQEATLVLNDLTRGTRIKRRALPVFKEYTVFVKYSSVYLENHPASDVGSSMYDMLAPLIPMEAAERSEEMERRMHQEIADQEARSYRRDLRKKEKEQSQRGKAFDVARSTKR